MLSKRLVLCLALPLLTQCSTRPPSDTPPAPPAPPLQGLSFEEAFQRSRRVSDIHYNLSFNLNSTEESFSGVETVEFTLSDATEVLRMDFTKGSIESIEVNGQKRTAAYDGRSVSFSPKELKNGANAVTIHFSHPYSTTGSGFYRLKDPKDGRVYTYSDFEPFHANLLFPCFDQPDLKADYKLKVEAPAEWTVISSTREKSIKSVGAHRVWDFPTTAIFSTYVFSLHAGPYKVWTSQAGNIPLRLFARQSMVPYVKVDDWFKVTKQGLAFYQKYFAYHYPFKKYDQILVPDFNAGAMENVAAVTFAEHMIVKGEPTEENREALASVILHEMAHMWFGDLVTMKWWNDLWLNESFATYMSAMALHDATEFKRSWLSFYSNTKEWAYWQDGLVTTHPIDTPVPSTDQAFANFDGITYGKGASVLKQLSYYLGADNFRDGVRLYFKKHAFGNTRRANFMGALSTVSGIDLSSWAAEWIETAGLNKAKVRYACQDNRISDFEIVQTAPEDFPMLRTHKTEIGLYGAKGGKIALTQSVPAVYADAVTKVAALNGKPCPLFVYPNFGDYDYVKVSLDNNTLQTAKDRLNDVEDPFARMMLWVSLWNMVQDAELPLTDYVELALKFIPQEKDPKILLSVLTALEGPTLNYFPKQSAGDLETRAAYIRKLENFSWSGVQRSPGGSDFQKIWFDAYIKTAESPEALRQLADILSGTTSLPKFKIDQDRRWEIIERLSAEAYPGVTALIDQEKRLDTSSEGEESAIMSEASLPNMAIKKKWFDAVASRDSGLSLAQMKAAMRGLFPRNQETFRAAFANSFYDTLIKINGKASPEFTKAFPRYLVPSYCKTESIDILGEFIGHNPELVPIVMKTLRIAKQEDERCLKIRALALQHSL